MLVLEAHKSTGRCMIDRLMTSTSLKHMASLDPVVNGYTDTHISQLHLLLRDLPNLLSGEEEDEYEHEIRKLQVSRNLPPKSENIQVDQWWTPIFHCGEYPNLTNVVKACLSIFTAPRVEQSFSIMNDVLTSGKTSMSIKTLDSLQTVTYYLNSRQKSTKFITSSVDLLHRENVRKDPVDSLCCKNLQRAHCAYAMEAEEKRKENLKPKLTCHQNPAPAAARKHKKNR